MVNKYVLIKWTTIYPYPRLYFQALILTLVILNHSNIHDCSNSHVANNCISHVYVIIFLKKIVA